MTVASPLYTSTSHSPFPSHTSPNSLSLSLRQGFLAGILKTHHPNRRNFIITSTHPSNSRIPSLSRMGGLTIVDSSSQPHHKTHKFFLFCNYILLGAASSCIFLTLSLRLVPSLCGFFLILLHILTIAGAISGLAATSSGKGKWYAAHMVATVLTAIFQGSVSVLIFTRTGDFLGNLKSYVREEDGEMILKLAGGLCILMFFLEWVVLTLAFFLKYYEYVEGDGISGSKNSMMMMRRSGKVNQGEEEMKDWPWPFQV